MEKRAGWLSCDLVLCSNIAFLLIPLGMCLGAPKRFLGLFSESGVDGTLGDGALVVGFLVGVVNSG